MIVVLTTTVTREGAILKIQSTAEKGAKRMVIREKAWGQKTRNN
jgi:hypothetical protein